MVARVLAREELLAYTLLVTDLQTVWVEEVSREQFLERWHQLNSDLEGLEPVEGLREVVKALGGLEGAKGEVGEQGGTLELAWSSEGLPLHWRSNLTLGSPALHRTHLTCPLLSSVAALLSQRSALCSLLRAKDLELEDLKGGGAVPSLPQLTTQWFDKEMFLQRAVREEVGDPLAFLAGREVAQVLQLKSKEQGIGGEGEERVDGRAPQAKTKKASPTSSPVKLSSKRPAVRPDLSKYSDKNRSTEKRARLKKLM